MTHSMKRQQIALQLTVHGGIAAGAFIFAMGALGPDDQALAAPSAVSGEVLKTMTAGTTIEIDGPMGTRLPISYGADGKMSGKARGILVLSLGSSSDHGRWWVKNDRLCQKFTKWFDAETSCMSIHRDGSRIRWHRDDGRTGTATITAIPAEVVVPPLTPPLALGGPLDTPASSPAPQLAPPVVLQTLPKAVSRPARKPVPRARAPIAQPAEKRRARRLIVAPLLAPQPPSRPAVKAAARIAPRVAPVAKSRLIVNFSPYRVANVRGDDLLNIRVAPHRKSALAGTIPPDGRGIRMIGRCKRGWCRIGYGGITGWVSGLYLAREDMRFVRR